jgi:hypothetical protein
MCYINYFQAKLFIPVGIDPPNAVSPIDTITRPIRKKCYSLLYHEIVNYSMSGPNVPAFSTRNREQSYISVTEVLFDVKTRERVGYINVEVNAARDYPITNLWLHNVELRAEIFAKLLNGYEVMKSIKIPYASYTMLPCLVLRCLIKEEAFLREDELDAFLLTFVEMTRQNRRSNFDIVIFFFIFF